MMIGVKRKEIPISRRLINLRTLKHLTKSHGLTYVLVSAGIELIFFLVAGIMLWFRFSMRIMLITLMFSSVVAK